LDRLGSTNLRSAPEVVRERGSGLRKEGFDSGPIDKVHKLVDVTTTIGQEVGIVGVFIDIQSENGSDAPDRVAVLGVADVVEEFFRAVVVSGPGPTTGGDPGGFEVLFIVLEGSEILIDMFENPIRWLSVSAQDREVEFMVFEAADGKGEVHLEGAYGGVDLIRNGGVGGVGSAHFFQFGEDAVALIDVAGVELEMLLMSFIGNFACFSLHFCEEGFLLVRIGIRHERSIPQSRGGVKPSR
jgi:hypothetical protein